MVRREFVDYETGEVGSPPAKDKPLDGYGREIPDPTPMAPPLGYQRQPTMVDIMRGMIRSHQLAMEAAAAGYETFDEADDFDVGDVDPSSPYEGDFEPVGSLRARREVAEAEERAARAAAEAGSGGGGGGTPPPVAAGPGGGATGS